VTKLLLLLLLMMMMMMMMSGGAAELLCNAAASVHAGTRQPQPVSAGRQTERRQQRLPQHAGNAVFDARPHNFWSTS